MQPSIKLIAIGIFIVSAHCHGDGISPKRKQASISECQKYVTAHAHDPSSVRFTKTPSVVIATKSEKELSFYEVTIEVRAKNGYNAYRLFEVKCDLFVFEDGTVVVINAREIQ